MPTVKVSEDTLVRGQKMMTYGDSWDSLINMLMDAWEGTENEFKR
jgi:hypothetical protein